MSEKVTISNTKHFPKSILHFEYQMHTQPLFSELGKTGITVNLGIYYSHKKYQIGGLSLDVRLQIFISHKLSNIYITQVNQMW
jgi:hypothetical protein